MYLWSMVSEMKSMVDDDEIGDGSHRRHDHINCKCDPCFILNMFEHLQEHDEDDCMAEEINDANEESLSETQVKRIHVCYERHCNLEPVDWDEFDEY